MGNLIGIVDREHFIVMTHCLRTAADPKILHS